MADSFSMSLKAQAVTKAAFNSQNFSITAFLPLGLFGPTALFMFQFVPSAVRCGTRNQRVVKLWGHPR